MKVRKKMVYLIIALVLAAQGNVVAVTCSDSEQVPISVYRDDALEIDPVKSDGIPRTWSGVASSAEEKYISPYVTSVKNQNPYGTCWAFAYIAASEASMVSEGLATLSEEEDCEIDLSELHLAYYLSHSVTDPLGGTAGDGFSILDTGTNAFLYAGGNQSLATYRVANWYGLVDETVAPYASIVSTESVALSDDTAYAEDVAHLENSYWISMEDMDTVKKLIKEYGACATSYCSEDQYYNTGKAASWYQDEEVAVYCPDDVDTNHGITIVGWDDNYSVDNFTGLYKPTENGAWYCKNSWGSTWSKDGYFWISYEDVSLLGEEAFFYDYGSADNFDKNYQYDGGAYSAYYTCNYAANIYVAQESEYIKAVGFYTYDSNYDCTVEVYKNCKSNNPATGTLLTSISANQLYAGFHTVELDDGYLLNAGESFSVVVYMNATDGEDTYIPTDANYSSGTWCSNTAVASEGQSFVSDAKSQWEDVSKKGYNCRIKAYTDRKIFVEEIKLDQSELILDVGGSENLNVTLTPENASDKGVIWESGNTAVATVDEDGKVTAVGGGTTQITCTTTDGSMLIEQCEVTVIQPVTQLILNYKSTELVKNSTLQLKASVFPDNANDKNVQWSTANEAVAVVSDNGMVTAKGYGTTTITCVATDRNACMVTCTINVTEKIVSISLNQTTAILEEGQTLQLNAVTVPDVEKTKGFYWCSSNAAIASVDADGLVTAVATGGPITIQCIAKDGSGVNSTCQITVKPKEESASLKTDEETGEDSQLKQQYKINSDGTAQFIAGKESIGEIVIPDAITLAGQIYKVTSVGANAFLNNKEITKVVIGANVKIIEKNAFKGCSNLVSVTMGDSVKSIGVNAFYSCKSLKSVTLGKNITTISDKAFYKCSALAKIIIPKKVNKIGKQAFYNCKKLKTITIQTSQLTSKKVGKNAFKGIHSKAKISVPKKKKDTYKKLLKKKGVGNKVTIK